MFCPYCGRANPHENNHLKGIHYFRCQYCFKEYRVIKWWS